ncbi:DUF1571 domain-containing protein [Fulvivirga sp. RKSG066]|uniref:DUF1571 domain-containing protein n=1 Tax=Fulvivirga aurantia TaxID=2529383 RepID=UPI0012BD06FE|nr:DUF1571 domain-containing protein [Fulvivirga aurantia]MTI21209.1 DUF1571 domain-containing protein [Fulvivirga aurantia]
MTKLNFTITGKTYILSLLIFIVSGHHAVGQDASRIAKSMFEKSKQIKTLSYTMIKQEQIDGELQKQIAKVKLQREPFMVYTKQIEPEEGLEVLYKGGDKTALINPNGFPWFNVKLDPKGSKMTKDQHHTIMDSGFDRFISILEHLFQKYEDQIGSITSVSDYTTKDGKSCWKLSFENPQYKIIDYKVKANEDLLDIGYKNYISAYMIMQLNDDVDSYDDVSEGQIISIPNDYSAKMDLLIDKQLMVPVDIEVYVDNALFEHYQFTNINIDPTIKQVEFTSSYEGYGF